MGTRSAIGVKNGNESFFVYVHWDGYPQGVGSEYLALCRFAGKARNDFLPLFLKTYATGFSSLRNLVSLTPVGDFSYDQQGKIYRGAADNQPVRYYFNPPVQRAADFRTSPDVSEFYPADNASSMMTWADVTDRRSWLEYIYWHDMQTNRFGAWESYNRKEVSIPYNRKALATLLSCFDEEEEEDGIVS